MDSFKITKQVTQFVVIQTEPKFKYSQTFLFWPAEGMSTSPKEESTYTILAKVLGHPLLMKGLTTLVISMSTNLYV